jgi:hypothetical protein
MKNFLIGLACVCALVAGCSVVSDKFMVAKIPTDLITYTGHDPNIIGYQSIEKLNTLLEEAKTKNIRTQEECLYASKLDAAVYSEVAKAGQKRLEIAQKAADNVFGQNGVAVNLLTLLLGAGAARWYSTATMYSEAEVQAEKSKVEETDKKILYTQAEVDLLVEKSKNG